MALSPSSGPTNYRSDIDGLRALAVLLVVGFHAFPGLVPGGYVGVDVFFVISGYLITGILLNDIQRDTVSFTGFYARRIRRIFPALVTVMLTGLIFATFFLAPHEFTAINKHLLGGAGFVSNFVLWNEAGYFDRGIETKPFMHLWSLGIEEQFYLVWPLLLFAVHKTGRSPFIGIAVIAVASFLLNILTVRQNEIAAFYSPLARFWELGAGGLLVTTPRIRLTTRWQNNLSLLGLTAILAAAFAFDKHTLYPGIYAALPVAGACLLLASGNGFGNRFLSLTPLVQIGLISYPLYLWHWPLLSFLRIEQASAPLFILVAVGLSAVLAWLTYVLIEKPLRFGANKRTKTIGLCIAMACMAAIAFANISLPNKKPTAQKFGDQLNWPYWADRGCVSQYNLTPCLANSATPKFMIMGDSHANHLYPGFALTQPPTAVIAAGDCLPLDGIYLHVQKNQSQAKCNTRNSFAENKPILAQNPGIKTVLISFRWEHILAGRIANPGERDLWGGVSLASSASDDAGKTDIETLGNSLARTIAYLEEQNLNVVLVRTTPELTPGLEEYCRLMVRNPPRECSIPRADYDEDRQRETPILAKLQQQFPKLLIYDPIDRLCDGDKCYLMKDGMLRYRDNHHLSTYGSAFLAEDIKIWMAQKGLLD